MKKVNLQKVEIKNIEDKVEMVNFAKQIGNQLYMNGRTIEECELGKRIYYSDGEINLTDKECEIVKAVISGYSYVARTAIENSMKE